jgi:hypothetical protein
MLGLQEDRHCMTISRVVKNHQFTFMLKFEMRIDILSKISVYVIHIFQLPTLNVTNPFQLGATSHYSDQHIDRAGYKLRPPVVQ